MTTPVRSAAGYLRHLNVFDATMLVIGGIIGSGIFLNSSVVAQRVGSAGLTVGVWALGGVAALAGALVFAELGARKPQVGGGYVYLRDAFGPLPGFLYGWTEALVINSGGIAAVSYTFARYALALVGRPDAPAAPVAVGAIVVLSIINYLGIKPGSAVQNTFTVLKLVALAGLIAAGLLLPVTHPVPLASVSVHPPVGAFATIVVVGTALVPILFSYGGWQSTNFVAEELKNTERDLPRALVMGTIVVILCYVLANVVYVKVLGVDRLAASTAPASDVMRAVLGPAGATLISLGVAVSTFGFLNLAILSAPRMYQAMAADGVFFGAAAKLHEEFRVPSVALMVQGSWAILLVLTKTYGDLLDFVVFGDWIFFGLTSATLFVYRQRNVGAPGGYRLPGYPWVPIIMVVVALYTVVSTVASNPRNAALGAALIAAGVPFFYYWRSQRRV
ncbi:MAG TPA: amino acid permease [Gemmatimonadales bacterium]|jgi:APA family basic amino acid/polyamine antiporter